MGQAYIAGKANYITVTSFLFFFGNTLIKTKLIERSVLQGLGLMILTMLLVRLNAGERTSCYRKI